jgi:hypothetical protein
LKIPADQRGRATLQTGEELLDHTGFAIMIAVTGKL